MGKNDEGFNNPPNTHALGGYWVGQILLRITSGSATSQVLGYCMNFDRSITIGNTYTATLAAASGSAAWRAVSYLLTWNAPSSNSEAAATQVPAQLCM